MESVKGSSLRVKSACVGVTNGRSEFELDRSGV